jgi:hypothetical protein
MISPTVPQVAGETNIRQRESTTDLVAARITGRRTAAPPDAAWRALAVIA